MDGVDKIKKDPRIMEPLAELLQKIQEIFGTSQPQTNHPPSSKSQDPSPFHGKPSRGEVSLKKGTPPDV